MKTARLWLSVTYSWMAVADTKNNSKTYIVLNLFTTLATASKKTGTTIKLFIVLSCNGFINGWIALSDRRKTFYSIGPREK